MLKNLSIRTCLTLMIVFFGLVLLFGAAAGLLSLRSSNASLQQMYTVDTPAVADLEGSAGQLLRLRLALATYASLVDLNDQDGANAVLKRFDQYQKASNDRLAHYVSRASTDADEQRLIKDMQDKRDTFLHDGVEPALAALKAGDKNAFEQLQAHKLPSLYSAYEKAMLTLEQLQIDHGAQRYQDAQDLFYAICIAVAVGMGLSLLGALIGRAVHGAGDRQPGRRDHRAVPADCQWRSDQPDRRDEQQRNGPSRRGVAQDAGVADRDGECRASRHGIDRYGRERDCRGQYRSVATHRRAGRVARRNGGEHRSS